MDVTRNQVASSTTCTFAAGSWVVQSLAEHGFTPAVIAPIVLAIASLLTAINSYLAGRSHRQSEAMEREHKEEAHNLALAEKAAWEAAARAKFGQGR
jgi:hypothetical protein